jgi:hypothetical protein
MTPGGHKRLWLSRTLYNHHNEEMPAQLAFQ